MDDTPRHFASFGGVPVCMFAWPGCEDAALHACTREPNHDGPHVCPCGELQPPENAG